eukprot:IDg5066t1
MAKLLSDNGKTFTAKLVQIICRSLRESHILLKRTNHRLTYKYNALQALLEHRNTGKAPFFLVMSRPLVPVTIKLKPSFEDAKPHGHVKMLFLSKIRSFILQFQATLSKDQARYKLNFDNATAFDKHLDLIAGANYNPSQKAANSAIVACPKRPKLGFFSRAIPSRFDITHEFD